MTHIVVSGYYGFDNAGDEAMLDSIVTNLQGRWPGLEITVLSADPQQTTRLHGVKAIRRTDFGALRRVFRNADLLLSGGGSLLQDVTSPYSIPYYLGVASLARVSGVRVMFFAQGIGPIRSPWNRQLVRMVGNRVDYITVRDKASLELLTGLGISRHTPVELTADAVLALTPGDPRTGERLLREAGLTPRGSGLVGVSLREVGGQRAHVDAVIRACRQLHQQAGVEFLVIPMQVSQDEAICRDFVQGMDGAAYFLEGDYSARDIGSLFSCCDLVLGMRLHSLIFGALAGTPVAGISYDPKVDGFLAQLDLEALGRAQAHHPLDGDRLARNLLEVWEQRCALRTQLADRLGALRSAALRNFEIVGSLLRLPVHEAST